MSNSLEQWISVEEAAKYLGVTSETIRAWIKTRELPARKIGRCWKLKASEIDEWVRSGRSAID